MSEVGLSKDFIDVIPQAMRSIRNQMRASARDEMTVAQFRVLAALNRDASTNSQLADTIGVSVPAMSRLVDGLVRRGWVERAPVPLGSKDRRQVTLRLSTRGRRKFGLIRKSAQRFYTARFESLVPEQRVALNSGLAILRDLFTTSMVLLGAVVIAAHARPAFGMSINDAVSKAIGKNPTAAAAREKLNEFDQSVPLAVSLALPQLSAVGLAQGRKDALNTANPLFGGQQYNLYDVEFKAVQPIWDGGAFIGALGAAKKERQQRELEYDEAERDVTLTIVSDFYSVLLNQRHLESLRHTEKVTNESVLTTHHRERIGRSQTLDTLQIKTQAALLETQIAQAEAQVQESAAQLAIDLGERQADQLEISGSLDTDPWEQALATKKDLKARIFEIEHSRIAVEEVDDKSWTTLAPHFPTVSLQGTYGRQSYVGSQLLDGYSEYYNFGVTVTVPIFSGLSSIFQRRQIASQRAQLEIADAQVRDTTSLNQVKAEKDLASARTALLSAKRAYDLGIESLNEARKDYRLGTIDYLQFLTTQNSELTAEFSYDQARYTLITALTKSASANGLPIQQIVQGVDHGK